jgi:protein LTV1
MGKKKSFIDKKRSTTYTLVYSDGANPLGTPEEADRLLVANEELNLPVAAPGHAPPSDPRSLYRHFFGDDDGEEAGAPLSEQRRRELLELGFPDDDYDYFKHCKVLNSQPAAAAQAGSGGEASSSAPAAGMGSDAAGPRRPKVEHAGMGQSVFIPAPRRLAPHADVKLVDARSLAALEAAAASGAGGAAAPPAAAANVEGVPSAATAPAASRQLHGKLAVELAELEAAMNEVPGRPHGSAGLAAWRARRSCPRPALACESGLAAWPTRCLPACLRACRLRTWMASQRTMTRSGAST